jgi:ribosomal protein S18 acetylase RimI-like enzyme
MNIRIMTINDYEQVYSLWLNTPNMGLTNLDDSRDGIGKYLSRNPNTCFVALKDGDIVGVILSGHDGRRGFIYHVAVTQNEQRQGIGSSLVNEAMSALEREGIHKVALVVYVKNQKGNAFWEKYGFTSRNDLVYRNKTITELTRIDT